MRKSDATMPMVWQTIYLLPKLRQCSKSFGAPAVVAPIKKSSRKSDIVDKCSDNSVNNGECVSA
jgi:hypothetical protein